MKEIKDSSSQHEDDNISTTSGFSSRASDKGKAELPEFSNGVVRNVLYVRFVFSGVQ